MSGLSIKEFGLVIIESLGENDKKTGTILHDEIIKYKKFQEPDLSSYIYQVVTKEELFKAIDEIIEKNMNNIFLPILHFETHGFEEGIVLKSKEIIEWKELFSKTRELNILLKNTLVLHLGMCKGEYIISKINPLERAPFKAIIGTSKNIDEKKLLEAFEVFYDSFFFSFSPLEAVDKMNKAIDAEKKIFHLIMSDHCFDEIVNPNLNPSHLERIINQLAIHKKITNPRFESADFEVVRKYIEDIITKRLSEIKFKKDYFTMTDLK
ncbi:MAG: hypothetical protein AB7S54_07215 [Bacteroidales bacterium]